MTDIICGERYRIDSPSTEYFERKYGEPHPVFRVEDLDTVVFGQSWMDMDGNPACLLYAIRVVDIPISGKVYYGKIGHLGELIHESELVTFEDEDEENARLAEKCL